MAWILVPPMLKKNKWIKKFQESAGVTLEVNLRNPLCTDDKAGKRWTHPVLKPRADVNKSFKQERQWPTQRLSKQQQNVKLSPRRSDLRTNINNYVP